MLLVVLPAALAAQTTRDVNGTLRAEVGQARGDGGHYRDRRLNSFSMALDFARHRDGGSGPVIGFGFTYYQATGNPYVMAYDWGCPPYTLCTASAPVHFTSRFPDVRLGFIDVGWRKATESLRGDVMVQPGMALMARPDIAPVALGGGASVTKRIFRSFGVELGASSVYLPAYEKARIGLSQVTLGLRSW